MWISVSPSPHTSFVSTSLQAKHMIGYMLHFHIFLVLREMTVIFVLVIMTELLYGLIDSSRFSYSSESREVQGHCNRRFCV